ncbi:MAG: hypothetical protein R2751_19420 [Bacteroidales bacterium]
MSGLRSATHGLQGIYLSSSESACRTSFGTGTARIFPSCSLPLLAGRMMNQGFAAWLKQVGLATAEMTLAEGYASLEDVPQDLAGWMARALILHI